MIAWSGGTPAVAARTLRDIFEDAKRADCAYCAALAGEVCAFSGTGPDGLHVGKFAAAAKAGLISGEDLVAVLQHAHFFNVSTVVYEETPVRAAPKTAGEDLNDDDVKEPEPYCTTCGGAVGIFLVHGKDWRHYRGERTADSPVEIFDPGHAPEVAWRPAGAAIGCDADWGSGTKSQVCTKPEGHDGLHVDSEGYEWGDGVTPHRTRPADAPARSLVGRLVEDLCDDSPCPLVGLVVGQAGEDTLEVLWGDRRFEENPGPGTYEPFDALRPARDGAR